MSLFGDSPRSRFNTFDHRSGCTVISSRLAFQKCALENLQQSVQEDIPKNKSGYHFATPCTSRYLTLCMYSSCLHLCCVDVSYMYRVLNRCCSSSSYTQWHTDVTVIVGEKPGPSTSKVFKIDDPGEWPGLHASAIGYGWACEAQGLTRFSSTKDSPGCHCPDGLQALHQLLNTKFECVLYHHGQVKPISSMTALCYSRLQERLCYVCSGNSVVFSLDVSGTCKFQPEI